MTVQPHRAGRVRALVLVAVLALGACGGGATTTAGAPTSTDGPSTTRPPATTTSTTTSATSTTAATTSSTTTTSTTTTTASTTTSTTAPPPPAPAPVVTTAPPPPPLPAGDDRVFVLGDSVLLGAATTVPDALVGWAVTFDALGSRRLPQAIEVLRARRAEIGRVVVIQQGNNYIAGEGSFAAQIDEAMAVLAGVERVVWLTVAEKWPSRVEINAAIRAAPQRWPQAVVADWASVIAAHPEYAGDMLHLTAAGRVAIAQLIASHVGPP